MRRRLVLPKNYCNRYQRQLMVTTRKSGEKSWNDAMQMVTFDILFHQFTCGCSHARKIKVVHGTSKEYHGGKNPFEPCIHFWQQTRLHFFLGLFGPVTTCCPSPERESQRRLIAKSYFFRTAQNDFSARFRIGQKYAQPESALKPILDLFFFPRGVVFSQSPAKSLFFSV